MENLELIEVYHIMVWKPSNPVPLNFTAHVMQLPIAKTSPQKLIVTWALPLHRSAGGIVNSFSTTWCEVPGLRYSGKICTWKLRTGVLKAIGSMNKLWGGQTWLKSAHQSLGMHTVTIVCLLCMYIMCICITMHVWIACILLCNIYIYTSNHIHLFLQLYKLYVYIVYTYIPTCIIYMQCLGLHRLGAWGHLSDSSPRWQQSKNTAWLRC